MVEFQAGMHTYVHLASHSVSESLQISTTKTFLDAKVEHSNML